MKKVCLPFFLTSMVCKIFSELSCLLKIMTYACRHEDQYVTIKDEVLSDLQRDVVIVVWACSIWPI
jgi:hypothetical protein